MKFCIASATSRFERTRRESVLRPSTTTADTRRPAAGRLSPRAFAACLILAAAFFAFAPPQALAAENVTIYADDCSTPRTVFYLGDTVCVIVKGAPAPNNGWRQRRFQWVTPHQIVTQEKDIDSPGEKDLFTIPTSGNLARTGKWSIRTIDNDPAMQTRTHFTVKHPRLRIADLYLYWQGPWSILPNTKVRYGLTVINDGPEDVRGVEVLADVPEGMTFYAMKQASGPEFRCEVPPRGYMGRIVCLGEALRPEEKVSFDIYYLANEDLREGEVLNGLAQVWNKDAEEAEKDNNFWTLASAVAPRDTLEVAGDPDEPYSKPGGDPNPEGSDPIPPREVQGDPNPSGSEPEPPKEVLGDPNPPGSDPPNPPNS